MKDLADAPTPPARRTRKERKATGRDRLHAHRAGSLRKLREDAREREREA